MRDAADVCHEFALQAGWRVGREFKIDRVGGAAKALRNGLGKSIVSGAGGEDAHDVIGDLGRHVTPASGDRHPVQLLPQLFQPVQRRTGK